ncbi:7168_t:CDS:2, partial [Racocetra fulgida]
EFKEIDHLERELEKREQLKVLIKKDGMKRRKKKVLFTCKYQSQHFGSYSSDL